MKRLRFPNDNNLILLNKGGSALLGWIIKFYCDSKGISIRHNELGRGKKVLVIRNSLERFLSGFLHQLNGDSNQILTDLHNYLQKCFNGEIEREDNIDYHLWRAGKIMDRENIQPDVVIKIEDLEIQMEEWGRWNLGAREPQWEIINPPPYQTHTPNLMKELELPYEDWDGVFLKGLWLQSKENTIFHHRIQKRNLLKKSINLNPSMKDLINKWVEDDMLRWGYKTLF